MRNFVAERKREMSECAAIPVAVCKDGLLSIVTFPNGKEIVWVLRGRAVPAAEDYQNWADCLWDANANDKWTYLQNGNPVLIELLDENGFVFEGRY